MPRFNSVGWLVMGSAAVGRVLLGALVAGSANASLPTIQTQAILQILFLQGGLAALLSASAYARAAHLASAPVATLSSSAHAFVKFVTVSTGVSLLLGWAVVPDYDLDRATHLIVVSLMVLGAAATAVNAFLQGSLVGGSGRTAAAFWPVVLTSAVAIAVGSAAFYDTGIVSLTLIWVAPQIACPFLLALTSPTVVSILRASRRAPSAKGNFFALTGTANSSSVALAFIFRERWAGSQSDQTAATTFTIVRLTEIVYQVASMVLSSLPSVSRRVGVMMSATTTRRSLTAVLGLTTSAMCILPTLLWAEWSVQRLLFAELMTAPARVLAMVTALALLSRGTTRAYVLGIACTMCATLSAIWIPAVQTSPFGLHAFQAGGTLPIVLVSLMVARRDASTRIPDQVQ